MAKRVTASDEIERLEERLFNQYNQEIQDRDTFDLAFRKMIPEPSEKQLELSNRIWNSYKGKHNVSNERLFTKAKGKNFKADKSRTAKEVTTSKRKYIRRGASKIDLAGYDTAKNFDVKKSRRIIDTPARVKGKVVYAEKTFVMIRKKSISVYRDSKGRFASVKK